MVQPCDENICEQWDFKVWDLGTRLQYNGTIPFQGLKQALFLNVFRLMRRQWRSQEFSMGL